MLHGVTIRSMTRADLSAVAGLERSIFPDPWSQKLMTGYLDSSYAGHSVVLEQDHTLIGYAFAKVVADELHVDNIAIHASHRQQGLGTYLLKTLLANGQAAGCRHCYLEVRKGNTAAIALYTQLGFSVTSQRTHYYHDGEDALLMTADLHETKSYGEPSGSPVH